LTVKVSPSVVCVEELSVGVTVRAGGCGTVLTGVLTEVFVFAALLMVESVRLAELLLLTFVRAVVAGRVGVLTGVALVRAGDVLALVLVLRGVLLTATGGAVGFVNG
jgi:hypothetical protein